MTSEGTRMRVRTTDNDRVMAIDLHETCGDECVSLSAALDLKELVVLVWAALSHFRANHDDLVCDSMEDLAEFIGVTW